MQAVRPILSINNNTCWNQLPKNKSRCIHSQHAASKLISRWKSHKLRKRKKEKKIQKKQNGDGICKNSQHWKGCFTNTIMQRFLHIKHLLSNSSSILIVTLLSSCLARTLTKSKNCRMIFSISQQPPLTILLFQS